MRRLPLAALVLLFSIALHAQPVFSTIFPPEEYAARRAQLFAQIGDGVAILQATTERPGEQAFRQGNQFFYLCGVQESRAILVLDGRTHRTTLYLKPLNPRDITSKYGPGLLEPGDAAVQATGLDAVLPRDHFATALAQFAADHRTIYTPFRPETLGEASSYDTVLLDKLNHADTWDGRDSREQIFRAKLKAAAPGSDIRDLDPIVDALRAIKSPREITIIREATRITMLGIERAMHNTRPGVFEYQLQADAEYIFKKYGSFGPSYFALVATGPNTWYTHYHRNTAQLEAGQLVQLDDAPDYKYYSSDLSRIFPVDGYFTKQQLERYSLYLNMYQILLHSIAPHLTPHQVLAKAVPQMDASLAAHTFHDDATRAAFQKFVADFHQQLDANSPHLMLGHSVGMEVHDQAGVFPPYTTLEPGAIFTIEPMVRFEDDHTGLRIEDMLLITPTGVDNLSADLPEEPAAIEKLMHSPLPADLR
jgi:Xaa-Pro aminopeptidase